MKYTNHIPTFENFVFEGMMSKLDSIRQESKTLKEFIKKAIEDFPEIKKMEGYQDFLQYSWEASKKLD